MKQLEPVIVGKYVVQIFIEPVESGIKVTASCVYGEHMTVVTDEGIVTMGPKHDRSPKEMQSDLAMFASRLATNLAGNAQTKLLKETLFS